MDLRTEMDGHEYLFLRAIEEPSDNILRVVIEEARASGTPQDLRVGGTVLGGCREVQSDGNCAAYEVVFTEYVAYSVRNESYTARDQDEEYEGRLFRVYRKSKFLDYVRAATIATEEYPGPFAHYELVCENHILDIASTTMPEIKRMPGAG